jgi:uncharacterized protein
MHNNISPVQQQERAQILDVLRGLAILGILLNNIYGFSGYGFLTEEMRQQFNTFKADQFLNFLQITFVEGKFYSLFSLLFGIGFSIILIRNQQKGINPLPVFYRRLGVLLLIGAAHLYFLWQGDILLLYALVGLLLPLFRNCSNKTLLIWATVFVLAPIAIDALRLWLKWSPGDFLLPIGLSIDEKVGLTEDNWRTYIFIKGSGFTEWWNWQQTSFIYRYQYILNSNRILKVLGMFLIGFYVGRKMIYANLDEYGSLFRRVMKWGFALGLPASIVMYLFEGDGKYIHAHWYGLFDTVFYALSVVPLSLAYASAICLFWIKRKGISRLYVFAPVGRMALTNYLMQTLIASFLFYGAGLGLGQKFGLVVLFPIVIGIYAMQVLYSSIWLKHFQYGPMEWIWRQLTYGERMPLKKPEHIYVVKDNTAGIESKVERIDR